MGIASGDFNADGMIDLHVTNFWQEPSNLFVQTTPGVFSDETLRTGLYDDSLTSLGFGTQSRDFDNDGQLDLAVLNGHVFGDPSRQTPFRMLPQIFRGSPRGFSLQPSRDGGEYFSDRTLGRTLAVADMNRDGKVDLICSHLDRPLALLENVSEATGNWIQFQLIGTDSERDAIGARLAIHVGDRVIHVWRTAGDGYLCTNESILHIGLGATDDVVLAEVYWPSGRKQTIKGLPVNARYVIVEGDDDAYRVR